MSFDLPGKLQAAGPKRLIYQRRKIAVSALADLACLQSLRLRTASGSYPTGSGSAKHCSATEEMTHPEFQVGSRRV